MSDVVVTVPKNFIYPKAPGLKGLAAWIAEGDAAGDPESGQEWWFTTYGLLPYCQPGERVYVVCEGRLRGYAPLVKCLYDANTLRNGKAAIAFVRKGGAVAVTIDEPIQGFRGWRSRWWDYADERPFPEWREQSQIAVRAGGLF